MCRGQGKERQSEGWIRKGRVRDGFGECGTWHVILHVVCGLGNVACDFTW